MFTGLVEGIGKIRGNRSESGNKVLTIEPPFENSGLQIGDSVAVNGCCLTITRLKGKQFDAAMSQETLDKTTLGKLKVNDIVNLERSLRVGSALCGHIVTGHVDGVAEIIRLERQGGSVRIDIACDRKHSPFLVNKGSVALDGISLTVIDPYDAAQSCRFSVTVIPHTFEATNLGRRRVGDLVNLETDILGKYVAKLLGKEKEGLTEEFLKEHGF